MALSDWIIKVCWLVALPLVVCLISGCSKKNVGIGRTEQPFLARRAALKTKLNQPGPSPQEWKDETPPPGVREVVYESGNLKLKAWISVPKTEGNEKRPALVFFHGGFGFGASDMEDCKPFVDADYVVMTPWLRGENGLPGHFEMFYGELDDAVAAVQWLSKQPYVDADRIYTFGHSSGGVLSALLSLVDDVPIKYGGSSGGLYGTDIFDLINHIPIPFDKDNPEERQLRVLPGNVRWMKREHYAYIGETDGGVMSGVRTARREMANNHRLLQIIMLRGDHFSSLPLAMHMFLQQVESNP